MTLTDCTSYMTVMRPSTGKHPRMLLDFGIDHKPVAVGIGHNP